MENESLGETSDGAELFQVFPMQISGVKPITINAVYGVYGAPRPGVPEEQVDCLFVTPRSDAASIGRENKP
jgi:hypothetical protein